MMTTPTRLIAALYAASMVLSAQLAPSRPIGEINPQPQAPQNPVPPPGPPGTQTAADAAAANVQASNAPRMSDSGALALTNVSLVELVDILARRLKINYILDPGVAGRVNVYTYGEVKPVDMMQLLETILRINGAAMVKVGDLYRIVPVGRLNQLPMQPMVNGNEKTLPDDERIVLNLIFLKFTSA